MSVKHLNPRQGITTSQPTVLRSTSSRRQCETPKSPPGDYNARTCSRCPVLRERVKHLNPRQGITTGTAPAPCTLAGRLCVKHLNPRQGITTFVSRRVHLQPRRRSRCETPKSPPGDYNRRQIVVVVIHGTDQRVKHLNPRQGITTRHRLGRS